jgi:hypothetical protein
VMSLSREQRLEDTAEREEEVVALAVVVPVGSRSTEEQRFWTADWSRGTDESLLSEGSIRNLCPAVSDVVELDRGEAWSIVGREDDG